MEVPWGYSSRPGPCHRCVTRSRNQEDTEGHARTRRRAKLSTDYVRVVQAAAGRPVLVRGGLGTLKAVLD